MKIRERLVRLIEFTYIHCCKLPQLDDNKMTLNALFDILIPIAYLHQP